MRRERAHLAAIVTLLGGWLLMHLPPNTKNGREPYRDWWQWAAFDSAEECEKAREKLSLPAKKRILEMGDKKIPYNRTEAGLDAAYAAARCIPAEHIYPPAR